MNSATHTPMGTAMAIAMIDAVVVVQSNSMMPNRGLSPPTDHSREVRKLASFFDNAGMACETRNTPTSVTRATTATPAPCEASPNQRSPPRRGAVTVAVHEEPAGSVNSGGVVVADTSMS